MHLLVLRLLSCEDTPTWCVLSRRDSVICRTVQQKTGRKPRRLMLSTCARLKLVRLTMPWTEGIGETVGQMLEALDLRMFRHMAPRFPPEVVEAESMVALYLVPTIRAS